MPNRSTLDDKSLQFNALYEVMDSGYRESVVSRALGARGQISSGATTALNSAIQKSRIRVTGYRDAHLAPHPLLRAPVCQAIALFPELAAAVLRAWAESHETLHDRIVEHLASGGIEAEYPDFSAKMLQGCWPESEWHSQRDSFMQKSGDDLSEDDVGLMLCYVTGKTPITSNVSAAEGTESATGEYLDQFFSYLKALPPTAREWRGVIPNFVESVSGLIEEKEAELKWADDFDAVLESVRTEFADLLTFFEQDTHTWAASKVSLQSETAVALRSVERLQTLLGDYQAVHDRAPGLTEERERIQLREELQPQILETLQEIRVLMTNDEPDASDGGVVPLPWLAAPPVNAASEPAIPAAIPALDQQAAPATSLQETLTAGDSTPPGPPEVSAAEYDTLKSDNHGLRETAAALSSENQDLRDEVEALKTELYSSQEMEESWRMAYRSAMDGSLEEEEAPPVAVDSVNEAVAMARAKFRQELLFSPNSESNIETNPYIYPEKVWEALQWLATAYYPSKLGRLRITDFDQSIRESCGWWYKGDQGETTLSRYEKSYTTRVDGKRHWLAEHIGKGTSFDARYTIRIAFNWDRERRQVIVGYIGRHQQTDAS